LGWTANDASLWEAAFVREFGPEAADAVRGATSIPQAIIPPNIFFRFGFILFLYLLSIIHFILSASKA
jgi:hypothetical protein